MTTDISSEMDVNVPGAQPLARDPAVRAGAAVTATDLPPLLSFFTGAGFMDLGIIQAGFRVAWSNEIDEEFADAHDSGMQTYFESEGLDIRHPAISSRSDMRDKSAADIRREATGNLTNGDIFGIIGGPPCPDFSVGGKNRGSSSDRGRLIQVFLDRIQELAPLFFLVENVKGLISTGRHYEYLLDQVRRLERGSYAVDIKLLNALDLGVPQDRERVFVIGIKKALVQRLYSTELKRGDRDWFPWPADGRYTGAKTRYTWPATSPFGGTPPRPESIPDELMVGPLVMNCEETARLPNGQEAFVPYSDKFRWIPEGDDSRKSFKRLHRYRFSPTAAYGNNEVHLHPSQPRRLTVREAMRIQTVPDTFALPAELPLSTKFKAVGNGVPVKMAELIGLALASFLRGERPPLQPR